MYSNNVFEITSVDPIQKVSDRLAQSGGDDNAGICYLFTYTGWYTIHV